MTDYNSACEKFNSDVSWLTGRWISIRHAFECDTQHTLTGDLDLEHAYRRICDLQEHIERIRAARKSAIKKGGSWKAA